MKSIKAGRSKILILAIVFLAGYNIKAQFRVVGYFANWNNVIPMAKSFDYSKVTHINYCFVNVSDNLGSLDRMDNGLDTLVKYAHIAGVKVLISMGGGSMSTEQENNYYYQIAAVDRRARFIDSITNYLDRYKLDGFDMDIEGDRINSNYGAFITQLSDSLKAKGKLLTAALGDWGGANVPDEVIPLFDFINIMSYDATGQWTSNDVGQHSSFELAKEGIEKWAARGAARKNLVVGLPFYCHAFNELASMDYKVYSEILNRYPNAYKQDTIGAIIFHNGIPTIQQKTCLALDTAGGVMIWELGYDVNDNRSLLKAIDNTRKTYKVDDLPPLAQIVKPMADSTITGNTIDIKTFISDPDGKYRKTKIYLNNVFLAESDDSLHTFTLTKLETGTYSIVIEAFDHQFRTGYDTLHVTAEPEMEHQPYNGSAIQLPGKIEAENFDLGGQSTSYYDATEANEGKEYRVGGVDIESCYDKGRGFDVGWTATGEMLVYTVNVLADGDFDFDFRASSTNSNKTISAQLDGADIIINQKITNSGAWQVWKTSTAKGIHLTAGEHELKILLNSGGFNLNYILVRPHVESPVDDESLNQVQIFPNPANSNLYIKANGVTSGKIKIYNSEGKLVQTSEYNSDGEIFTEFYISELSSGNYIISLDSDNTNYSGRFVKN
jgi:chitinase